MKKRRTVALHGSNLLMSAIVKSLQEIDRFEIIQIDGVFPGRVKTPGPPPDVIVYDLATVPEDFAVSALRVHPARLLIGVDMENGKMVVLSGEESRLLTVDDLVQAIEGGAL